MKILDRILLQRADEQVARAILRVGSGRREESRNDVRGGPAPKRWRRERCLGCGKRIGKRRLASYCVTCGHKVEHGTSLEAP